MIDPVSQVGSPTTSAKAKAAKRGSAFETKDDDMVSQQ